MKVLGAIQFIVFYIKTGFPFSKNVKNWGWDFFFIS
jgi:hypothetical protein